MRIFFLTALILAGCHSEVNAEKPSAAIPAVAKGTLRTVDQFSSISDQKARSKALFLEASKVLTHPRCLNCHPDSDTPTQWMTMVPHDPPVTRGPADDGVVGMQCTSCHQPQNLELARIPGAPGWHLAPRVMAWVGKSPHQICEQMKDPKRNGGRELKAIVEHNAHDELVGWGWKPGHDREPAPGTQAQFGALIAAWADSGAECPNEEARP